MNPVVFIPESISEAGLSLLENSCDLIAPWRMGETWSPDRMQAVMRDAEAVIVRSFEIRADDITRCLNLRVIARHGVGLDTVDIEAATARRIPVVFTPQANANAVAEHTVALMMALSRKIGPASRAIENGRFDRRSDFLGVELAGKTLCVVGLGRIGLRVARIAAHGLAMNVCAFDPVIRREAYEGPAVLEDSIEAALARADFLTLHVPLNSQTHHLINRDTLSVCKPGCRLINTSRGGVVEERALVCALDSGGLAGAALDVFEHEPVPPDHPLVNMPTVLLTPHIASSTSEAMDNMARDAAQGVLDVLEGRRPRDLANPEVRAC